MKKIFTLFLAVFGLGLFTLNAQAINQAANWPNPAWTLSGAYNAIGLLNDPAGDANFSFDDDAAGNGSSDILFVESPVIDLTAANAAGETLLNVVFDYDYFLGDVFQLEYFDADATAWVLWEILPENSTATSNWCGSIIAPEVTSVDLNTLFFTATQQSGFKYRFHYESVATWGWGVCVSSPTIVSSAPPTCLPPSALTASAITTTSATLGWTSLETDFDLAWGVSPLAAPTVPSVGFDDVANGVALTGLTSSTAYQYYVRADCDAAAGINESSWVGPFSFTTSADFCAGDQFIDDGGSSGNYSVTSPGLGPQTTVICPDNPGDIVTVTFLSFATESGWDGLMLYDGPSAASPIISSGSTFNRATCPNGAWNGTGAQALTGVNAVQTSTDPSGCLTFVFTADGTVAAGWVANVVCAPPPTCPNPNSLAASGITDIDADVSWTENGAATDWEIQYGAPGFAFGSGTSVIAVGTPTTTITGLTQLTNYEVYVRAICGVGDTSLWTAVASFTTELQALACALGSGNPSFLYTENFETDVTTGPGGSNGTAGPWTQVRTADPDWTWDGAGGTGSNPTGPIAAYSGTGFVYLETSGAAQDADTLTSGFYDLSLVNTPARLRFWYHMFGADIGTMTVETSGDGGVTWIPGVTFVGEQQLVQSDPWLEAVVDISYAVGANNFQVRFIGDKNNGIGPNFFYGDMAIDLIQIEACVSCVAPSAPTATVISFDSAQIDFTSFGSADSTFIEYGVAGFALGTGTVVSTLNDNIILAGLSGATSYDVYLFSDCSGSTGDSSVAAGPVSFLTPCSPFTPVYFEDFSSWTGTTTLPICWEEYDQVTPATIGAATPNNNGQWLQDGFANNAASPFSVTATVGSASIELWNQTDNDWLVSPEMDLTAGGPYQLDYNWIISQWSTYVAGQILGDDFVAVLITDDNGATWTELGRYDSTTIVPLSLIGQTAVFDLTVYAGSVVRIGFWGSEGTVDDPSDIKFFLDNFRVRPIPSCPEPTVLSSSNVTDVTVDLAWTENGAATDWEIQYGAPGFTPGTGTSVIVTGGTPSTTLSGLTQQTAYEFVVRAICGPADSSDFSFAASVTTLCAPLAAPDLETFESVPVAAFGDLGNCWTTTPTAGYRWESENSTGGNENSTNTGPFTDHTLAPAAGGIYMYTEASSGILGDVTYLNSPLVDLSGLAAANITFWYHMFGADMGSLGLEINDGTGWTSLVTLVGQQQTAGGDEWIKVSTNITSYTGIVSFRFAGTRGNGFTSDMSVDDVSIQEAPANEIGVTAISSPVSGCGEISTPITITVENFGVNTLLYTPVVVQLTGDFAGVYTLVIDTLDALSSTTLTLSSINTTAGGNVTVTAFTNLANDEYTDNDTLAISLSFGLVPMAPMVADVAVCDGQMAVLTPDTSVGIVSWYVSDTSSAPFFQGDVLMYTATNDTSFYVGQQETFSGTFTLDMFDSFGDGWNGASLGIEINGFSVLNSPFTIATGSVAQASFTAAHGDSIVITYFSGTFDGEVSYSISDPNGNVIFEDGFTTAVTVGEVFNDEIFSAGCPSGLSMVSVTVNSTYLDTVVMAACDSMMIAGVNQTVSGVYVDSLTSVSGCDSVVVYDLTINASNEESVSVTICDAATYTLPDGSVVNTAGLYLTTITNAAGCDSLVKTDLNVVASYSLTQNVQICADDSLVVGVIAYSATGTYMDTLTSLGGCDSVVTTNLVVYPAIDVTLGGVSAVCENAAVIDLTLDPIGGTLSGPGVTGTSFDASAAGVGNHVLVYTFTGPNGCDATASLNVDVVVCTGIDNLDGIETISIYPNPYVSALNIMFDDAIAGELSIKLLDVTGRVLMTQNVNTTVGVNNIALAVPADISAGVTVIQIERNGAIYSTTLIKK